MEEALRAGVERIVYYQQRGDFGVARGQAGGRDVAASSRQGDRRLQEEQSAGRAPWSTRMVKHAALPAVIVQPFDSDRPPRRQADADRRIIVEAALRTHAGLVDTGLNLVQCRRCGGGPLGSAAPGPDRRAIYSR